MSYSWTPTEQPLQISHLRHHHPLHEAASAAIGQPSGWYGLTVDGTPMGSALIGCRRWPLWGDFAVLGRGPVWAPELSVSSQRAALDALIETLSGTYRGVMAAPDPIGGVDPLAASGMLPVVTPISVAELPLDPDPSIMRARLAGKWRNRLVRAEDVGLHLRGGLLPPDPHHWVFKAEAAQRKSARYKGLPFAYTRAWIESGGRRSARLFTAEANGRIVAAMLFLLHKPGASYHIGWCDPEGRRLGAHPLLMWNAMCWLAERGFTMIDLDVIDTDTEPGLARFKLGTGAQVVTLGATRLLAPGTGFIEKVFPVAAKAA